MFSTYFSSENFESTLVDYEKIIENIITITKFYEGENNELLPEENIDFEIYKSDGSLFGKYTTDKDGIIKVSLPYGSYSLYQVTTKEGYDIVDKRIIDVKENDKKYEITLVNKKVPVKLEEEPKLEEPKEDIIIEENIHEIKELPNTGRQINLIPFLLINSLVVLILKRW